MELLIEIDRYLKNVAITEHHEILKIQQEYVKILKENLKIRDDIFDPNIDENKKVLISLSFLFLLCEKKDVIWESSNRVKVFDYFNLNSSSKCNS